MFKIQYKLLFVLIHFLILNSEVVFSSGPSPALLLTTYDTVSIVYPKEMGYEKDFLQTVYKLNQTTQEASTTTTTTTTTKKPILDKFVEKYVNLSETMPQPPPPIPQPFRIEDAVYDNTMSSIYIVISYLI